MQAIISAYMQIQTGMSEIVLAGGVEAMSSSPYIMKGHRWGQRLQHGEIRDSVWEVLEDPIHGIMMGETAENLAEIHGITREEQDELAYLSHQRAVKASEEGYFDSQIVPITVKSRRESKTITQDESPRAGLTMEKLAGLKPAFRSEGSVTAGNSSSLNDGGAALILMSEEEAVKRGLKPLAKITGCSVAGVDPKVMGRGPVPAIKKGLAEYRMVT